MHYLTRKMLQPVKIIALLSIFPMTVFAGTISVNYTGMSTAEQGIIDDLVDDWEARISCDISMTIDITWADLGTKSSTPPKARAGTEITVGKTTRGEFTTLGSTSSFTENASGYPIYASIELNNNSVITWYVGTGAVPSNEFDFMTVAIHELCHAVGFTVNYTLFAGHVSSGPGTKRTFDACPDRTSVTLAPSSLGTHLDVDSYSGVLMEPYTGIGERQPYHPLLENILNCAFPCTDQDYYVLVLDASGSMSDNLPSDPDSTRYMRALSWALQDVDSDIFPGAHDQIRAAVMYFTTSDDPNSVVELGFATNPDDVKDALNNIPAPLDASGRTPLARALTDAADIVHDMVGAGYRNVYVYTDGYENNSFHNSGSPVSGDCDSYLGGLDVWDEANWNHQCDPFDCGGSPYSSATCAEYQCCLADRLTADGIINARYFGQPVVKSGAYASFLQELPESPGDANPYADLKAGRDDPPDFAFLEYLAVASGGSFVFVCEDDTPPEVFCPDDIVVHNAADECFATVEFEYSATDNCPGVTVEADPPSGSAFSIGVTPVTVTATDASGYTSSCTFTVTVQDTVSPVIACPDAFDVEFTATDQAIVSFDVTATDNCDPDPTIVCTQESGSVFEIGHNTVVCTATDESDNADTCSFEFYLVYADIKPGSCPNPINIRKDNRGDPDHRDVVLKISPGTDDDPGILEFGQPKAVIPVAILGTDEFDVKTIRAETIQLNGVPLLRRAYEDVGTPVWQGDLCECTTAGADGYMDITLKFSYAEVVQSLLPASDGDVLPLLITGQTDDGIPIFGSDCVIIRGPRRDMEENGLDVNLNENYPNPFNPITEISFSLPEAMHATLDICNVLGQRVVVLYDSYLEAGDYLIQWNATDQNGRRVSSGIYFYRLTTSRGVISKKMMLLK